MPSAHCAAAWEMVRVAWVSESGCPKQEKNIAPIRYIFVAALLTRAAWSNLFRSRFRSWSTWKWQYIELWWRQHFPLKLFSVSIGDLTLRGKFLTFCFIRHSFLTSLTQIKNSFFYRKKIIWQKMITLLVVLSNCKLSACSMFGNTYGPLCK